MHPNEPYWIAVFASVGAEGLPFSRPTSCLHGGTQFQSPARRHPADAEPLLLLLVPSTGFHGSQIHPQGHGNGSKGRLDRANAFYLSVPGRLGTLKSPNT